MEFIKLFEDTSIYFLDFSGKIDLAEGLLRIVQLEKEFDLCYSNKTPFRLLCDFRNTIWDSIETHNILAKTARQKFTIEEKNNCKYIAILNNLYCGPTFKSEHWFTNKDEAINWLSQQPL